MARTTTRENANQLRWSSLQFQLGFSLLLCVVVSPFLGCSGEDPEPVAVAPPPPSSNTAPKPKETPKEPENEGYGSEEYSAPKKQQQSSSSGMGGYEEMMDNVGEPSFEMGMGGEPNSDGYGDMEGMGDYESEGMMGMDGGEMGGYGMGGEGDPYGGDPYGGDPYGGMEPGTGMGMEMGMGQGMGMEMGMGSAGMAPGMGGPQAAAGMAMAFVRQNCGNCHGGNQSKGGVSLAGLHGDFADPTNAKLWKNVVDQLEAGTMPPANSRRPDPNQQAMLVNFVKRSMEAAGDQDYLAQAKHTFASGKEKQAIELLYAHALAASEDSANELLQQARWGYIAGKKGYIVSPRPRFSLRFAVGVNLKLSPETLTDLSPIGSGNGSGGGGMMGGEYGGEGMYGGGNRGNRNNGGTARRSFNDMTGEFGSALVGGFETRWADGSLGSIFAEVTAIRPKTPRGAMGGIGMYGDGMYGDEGDGMYSGGEPGVGMGMGMGMEGGEGMGESFGGGGMRGGAGGGGMRGGEGPGAGPGYGGEGYGGGEFGESGGGIQLASLRDNIMPGETITPGLIFVGTGSQVELTKRAQNRGVDAIFIFDVQATENRRFNNVQNETKVRLIGLDGSVIGSTPELLNTEVERKRQRGGDDMLGKAVERLFAAMDAKIKMSEMPAMKPEHARARLQSLLAQREALEETEEATMNLQILYETRLFNSLSLLSQDEAAMVYQIVLEGNEGIVLADGNTDDRRLVIEQVLGSE